MNVDLGSAQAGRSGWIGDAWGGLAAMLVALPSAIAFGVTIFSPLGGSYAAHGALAGILGATVLGLIATSFGGTNRLITAPCAPAAALMAALALDFAGRGSPPEEIMLRLMLIGLFAGAIQIGIGLSGIGRLIRYLPYPVVVGYLSAVGITIIGSQLPRVLGVERGVPLSQALLHPQTWHWQSLIVAALVIGAMLGLPKIIRAIPPAIIALAAGGLAYAALGFVDARLWQLENNPYIVGPLAQTGGSLLDTVTQNLRLLGAWDTALLTAVGLPALSLAALLSIDTLKTCVVLDAMTCSEHDPNREMLAQGLGNIGSALLGGIPGAGTMGASLVNVSSGAQTRLSGVIEGLLALLAFLALAEAVAWLPISALGAILLVIGYRMIDWQSLEFFRVASTRLDFMVVVTVIGVALTVNLIAASAAGILLAIMLYLREQARVKVLHAKVEGEAIFSRVVRSEQELAILLKSGKQTVVVELQGSLFFGTANQLYKALEPEVGARSYVILSLQRVQSLDLSATHVLEQIKDRLDAAGGKMIFTEIPRNLPSGLKMKRYLREVGLIRDTGKALAFRQLDDALEWVEAQILASECPVDDQGRPLDLAEIEAMHDWAPGTLQDLASIIEPRTYPAGKKVLKAGSREDELLFIRAGTVRVALPLQKKDEWHIGTFGRGALVGEMGFLDSRRRSADVLAVTEVHCFVLSRQRFDALATENSQAAAQIFAGIAVVLAQRIRLLNKELRMQRS